MVRVRVRVGAKVALVWRSLGSHGTDALDASEIG